MSTPRPATPPSHSPRAPRPPTRPFVPAALPPQVRVLTSRTSKAWLIGALSLAYLLQFGLGVLTAVLVFVVRQNGELAKQSYTSSGYLLTLFVFGVVPVALSLGVLAIYRARAHWTWFELGMTSLPRTPRERRMWWRSAVTYTTALLVSGLLMAALSWLRGSGGYPEIDGAETARATTILVQALLAGVGEELLLVAFLVVAMEKLGARGPAIYLVAVTLRIAFHVYYGPPVLALILWAVTAVWLFRRTRVIWPLVIVHTLWDVNALSAEFLPVLSGLVLFGAMVTAIVVGIVHLLTRRRPEPIDHSAGLSVTPVATPSETTDESGHSAFRT